MNSHERLLAAFKRKKIDRFPISFCAFSAKEYEWMFKHESYSLIKEFEKCTDKISYFQYPKKYSEPGIFIGNYFIPEINIRKKKI